MVKSILLMLLIVFAVLGLCEFICGLRIAFFYPGRRFKSYSILFLSKGNAVQELRYLWEKFRCHGEDYSHGILAINDSLEDKEIVSCRDFAADKKIIICSSFDIKENLKQLSEENAFNG